MAEETGFRQDEPRTNVAYMLLKYHERGVFGPGILLNLFVKLYPDLVPKDGGLYRVFEKAAEQHK